MFILLDICDNYPEDLILKHNEFNARNDNNFQPTYEIDPNFQMEKLINFDYLTGGHGLISYKFAESIKKVAPDEIKIEEACLLYKGSMVKGYVRLLTTKLVPCIDMGKSITYRMLPSDPSSPLVISSAVFLEKNPGGYHIARGKEDPDGIIIISSELKKQLISDKISGIEFKVNGDYSND